MERRLPACARTGGDDRPCADQPDRVEGRSLQPQPRRGLLQRRPMGAPRPGQPQRHDGRQPADHRRPPPPRGRHHSHRPFPIDLRPYAGRRLLRRQRDRPQRRRGRRRGGYGDRRCGQRAGRPRSRHDHAPQGPDPVPGAGAGRGTGHFARSAARRPSSAGWPSSWPRPPTWPAWRSWPWTAWPKAR